MMLDISEQTTVFGIGIQIDIRGSSISLKIMKCCILKRPTR